MISFIYMDTTTLSDFIKWAKTTDLQEIICKRGPVTVEFRSAETAFNSYTSKLTKVLAPAIGIYQSKNSSQKAKLEEGMALKKGQFLGIIESHKKIVEVFAPKAGILKSISIKEDTAVEYNQPLFFID